MQVMLASANPAKILELKDILGQAGIEVIGLGDRSSTQEIETGSTFTENALLKARYYRDVSALPTIADDSGLEVEALGGEPGVRSARYGGPGASDADRINKLLDKLRNVPHDRRQCRFVCVAAIAWDGGERTFMGESCGSIMTEPRGQGGFGYDPVFFYQPLGRTFAELTAAEKAEVSHRGRAFRKLVTWLRSSGALDTPTSGDRIENPIEVPSLAPKR